MNLHEYQVKQLLAQWQLPVSTGIVCTTPEEALAAVDQLGGVRWVAKCQVHAGGRGNAGGVKLLQSRTAIETFARQWLGKRLVTAQSDRQGQWVDRILVDRALEVDRELYFSMVVDRTQQCVVAMASPKGGVDIEQVVQQTPHLLYTVHIDPTIGPTPFQGRQLAFQLGLEGGQVQHFTTLFCKSAHHFISHDLSLLEINPLIITPQGTLHCLDAKMSVDSNALFRQPLLRQMRDWRQEDPREAQAAQHELNYVALDGNIGCMVNGAGLAMATLDLIQLHGGAPANFLDVGGGVTQARVVEAFKLILSEQQVRAILVNIFGGIVRCDWIAAGIIEAVAAIGVQIPLVIRLVGNRSVHGLQQLAESGLAIQAVADLNQAAQQVVAAAQQEKKAWLS